MVGKVESSFGSTTPVSTNSCLPTVHTRVILSPDGKFFYQPVIFSWTSNARDTNLKLAQMSLAYVGYIQICLATKLSKFLRRNLFWPIFGLGALS